MSTEKKLARAIQKLQDVNTSLQIEIERLQRLNRSSFLLEELKRQVTYTLHEVSN